MKEQLEIDSQLPVTGLSLDTPPHNQPENSYRFGLNGVDDDFSGGQGNLSNEPGNKLYIALPDGHVFVGTIMLTETQQVVFSTYQGLSYIYWIKDGKSTELVKANLGFNKEYPITGEYRIRNGCNPTIYWRDSLNPDRHLTLNKLDDYKVNGVFIPTLFENQPDISYPSITTEKRSSGGNLNYGTYFFVIEALDASQNVLLKTLPQGRTEIVGGIDLSNSPSVGGEQNSNESIVLSFNNIDPNIQFLRINVISYVSNNKVASAHTLANLIPASAKSFVYKGFNVNLGDYEADPSSLLTDIVTYDTSKVMKIVQNRMMRGNLTQILPDYSNFQWFASKIKTEFVTKEVPLEENECTEISDEVKDYAIVYLDKRGQLSPPMHIPGRAKLATDMINDSIDGVSYPRWKTKDTSTPTQMGYYESDTKYLSPVNYCRTDLVGGYWGLDCDGNQIKDTNIRHHKIPSRASVPLRGTTTKTIIGTKFTNIEYPSNDIVGHFFVSVSNESVQASALATPYGYHQDINQDGRYLYNQNGGEAPSMFNGERNNVISFEHLFGNTIPNGDLMHLQGEFTASFAKDDKTQNKYFHDEVPYEDFIMFSFEHSLTGYSSVQEETKNITKSLNVRKKSKDASTGYYNNSSSNRFNIVDINESFQRTNLARFNYQYVSIISLTDNLSNLSALRYQMMHDAPFKANALTDEFEVYGGDGKISKLNHTNIAWVNVDFSWAKRDDVKIEAELIQDIYLESKISSYGRLNTTSLCNSFTSGVSDLSVGNAREIYYNYVQDKVTELVQIGTKEGYKLRDSICEEWFGYTKDLDVKFPDKYQFRLSDLHDYCSECVNRFPNRFVFSNVSLENDLSDRFRFTDTLSFKDIESTKGEITGLDYKENQLIVRTTDSSYVIQPNPQQIQTNENVAYLGTGDFLSIPERDLITTDLGYAGQREILASTNTPQGLVWADSNRGKIFLMGNGLEEISRYRMYHWFEQNMQSHIEQDFLKNDIEYKQDDFGIRMTYDPKFERVIVHKRDYKFTEKLIKAGGRNALLYQQGKFIVDGRAIEFSDASYFENKSWTISYSLRSKTWKYWHSYQPEHLFYGNNTFYTIVDNKIWSHNSEEYCNFYGIQFPYIIEIPLRDYDTFNLHSLHYHAKDGTFSRGIVYNDVQSSGLFTITEQASNAYNLEWNNTEKTVIITDENHKVAQLRDIATASPVVTDDWINLQNEYVNGQGYMDKLPDNVDYTKEQWDLIEFRRKWHLIRLYHDSPKKITLNLIQALKFYSHR